MPVSIGGSGPITGVTSINTTVSDTELGYLDGVTSALQSQLAGKADTTGNGAWTSWTPAYTNVTIGNGTNVGRYIQLGKLVQFALRFTLGSTSSVGGRISFTLPVSARTTDATNEYPFAGFALDASAGTQFYLWPEASGNTVYVDVLNVAGTYGSKSLSSATVPFTWAVSDVFNVVGTYEAA